MNNDLVTAVKLEKGGAVVVINGEETLWLSRALWLEKPLMENEAIDLEALKEWLLPRQYPEALNGAVALLALRARSSGELKAKLKQKHYTDETIDMVLYKLEKEHLLDDEAFAREWAEACARRQMGRQRIALELRQKGIDRELAQQVIDELDRDEAAAGAAELASRLLRKYISEKDPRKAMNKLLAAMARRGYGYEDAKAAIDAAMQQAREDEAGE